MGSALTGYSYLFRIGAWMFQAPLSYYSHSAQWELSPGYNLDDIGFTRSIATGCLICHNGQPEPDSKHDGKYKEPPFRSASWPSVAKHVTAPARYTCARCRRTQANNLPRSRWTAPSSTPPSFRRASLTISAAIATSPAIRLLSFLAKAISTIAPALRSARRGPC